MTALEFRNLVSVLRDVAEYKPVLGICLGMQAMLSNSEENGFTQCLGIFSGRVKRFSDDLRDGAGSKLKIPHMGWNRVNQVREHPMWHGIPDGSRFYFVHSYYACPDREADVAATSDYPDPFAVAIARGNIFAVQFHPEKSQSVGLKLLSNFLNWTPVR